MTQGKKGHCPICGAAVDCPWCDGTGIGWAGPDSRCGACGGSGLHSDGECENCNEETEE